MARLLVVDNEQKMCKIIKAGMELDGHEVFMAFSGTEALDLLKQDSKFNLVVTDLRMSGIDGLAVLKHIKENYSDLEVILITAFASQKTAVEAMRLGAYDYLIKPFEMEELTLRVDRILQQKKLMQENRILKEEKASPAIKNLVGKSKKMRQVYHLIEKVAGSDATVLIRGESGTGKELVAEAIHQRSQRANNRFMAMNCAAVPEQLLESELFGYEKGAFTGADKQKIGLFEIADKGTLFLDEVGDLPPGTQAKLLRVLQNREIIRIGGTKKVTVDIRIIAATNQNLDEMIKDGSFRSDLFYRLNIFPLFTPALREHKEDIPELVQHFLTRLDNKGITSAAKKTLMEYDWPGNIRELQNILERAAIIAEAAIDSEHLPPEIKSALDLNQSFSVPEEGLNLDDVEKQLIRSALDRAEGNKTKAAGLLGITRRRLYSMMERFGLVQ